MKILLPLILFATLGACAQQPTAPPAPVPQLSSAELYALRSIAEKNEELAKQMKQNEAMGQRILDEFAKAHPGYRIDPRTGTVVAAAKVAEKQNTTP